MARLQQIFQTTLSIEALFASPTVVGVTERIGEQMANLVADGAARLELKLPSSRDERRQEARIPRRQDAEPAPLSFAQQRVYFLDQIGAGAAYNMSASLWLTGQVNERALAHALDEISRRHDILRTYFPMRGDYPVQMVAPPLASDLAVIDLTTHADRERSAEAMRLATEEACQPFDLETGPLFRAKLVRLQPSRRRCSPTMHHIVSDGWSIGVRQGA